MGAQLWAMNRHHQITGNTRWLRKVAPVMIRMCNWIIAARKSNMAKQSKDDPCHGLVKYRPYADEPEPTYCYHIDTYLLLGLEETAAALRDLGMNDEASRIKAESDAYRKDVLDSMDKAVVERLGAKILPVFPKHRAELKRTNLDEGNYYGPVSSMIYSMVLETDILPAADRRALMITEVIQQRKGLYLGACAFWGGIDHAYSYGYWMNCLERDEVRRVILGLYTTLAYGMSRDTYSSGEAQSPHAGVGDRMPHLYSGTQQLLLLRNMLLRESGETLILGQAVPRPWLENGKEVRVEDAPTSFGKVGYTIKSHDGAARMTVRLDPPTKKPPKAITIRLRHPAGKPIQSVKIDGVESKSFSGDTLTLTGVNRRTVVEAAF